MYEAGPGPARPVSGILPLQAPPPQCLLGVSAPGRWPVDPSQRLQLCCSSHRGLLSQGKGAAP